MIILVWFILVYLLTFLLTEITIKRICELNIVDFKQTVFFHIPNIFK